MSYGSLLFELDFLDNYLKRGSRSSRVRPIRVWKGGHPQNEQGKWSKKSWKERTFFDKNWLKPEDSSGITEPSSSLRTASVYASHPTSSFWSHWSSFRDWCRAIKCDQISSPKITHKRSWKNSKILDAAAYTHLTL